MKKFTLLTVLLLFSLVITYAQNAGEDQTICENYTQMNANTVSGGVTAFWSITSGGCEITELDNPNTTITNISPGILTLRWNNEENGITTYDDVVIHTMPEPDFTINPQDAGCHPFNAILTNSTNNSEAIPGTLYDWFFDGNLGEMTNVSYDEVINQTFVNPLVPYNPENPTTQHDSIYNVRMIAHVNIDGTTVCRDTVTKPVTVYPVPYVGFDISGDGQEFTDPTIIGIENTSSSTWGEDAYSWDFGNGVAPPAGYFEEFFSVPYYNWGTYTITLTITSEQCSADSSITFTILQPTNINIIDNKINIFPNPATNFIKIDTDFDCEISIINITGKTILQTTEKEINIQNLEKGIYILKTKTEYKTYFKKLIKQ